MNILFTFLVFILLPAYTGLAQKMVVLPKLYAGCNAVFLHVTDPGYLSEETGMMSPSEDYRLVIPSITIGYGSYVAFPSFRQNYSFGVDYDIRITLPLTGGDPNDERASVYYGLSSNFAAMVQVGAGNGKPVRGFGYGGGLGVMLGLGSFSNNKYDVVSGLAAVPQLLGEVHYAVSTEHLLSLRLYVDLVAQVEMNDAIRMSMRQVGTSLRYSL